MTSLLSEMLAGGSQGDLNEEQQHAMRLLAGESNVFLTGGAGTGKSHVLRKFMRGVDPVKMPILASTGAAAVLVGGRTFHSFFGLGIMEGGVEATIERALKDKRVVRRLKKAMGFVLDEVSMIPGIVLSTAERLCCMARGDMSPWGGLKVVAVGDFAQLPPVTPGHARRDWAFLSEAWSRSQFESVHLHEMMRVREDQDFCEILADVRVGKLSERVRSLLNQRASVFEGAEDASVLYARKVDVDRINNARLAQLEGQMRSFDTIYRGEERFLKAMRASAPVPECLELKENAFVMIRQNDPQGRWVNGSLGHIKEMDNEAIVVRLLSKRDVEISKASFTLLNAEGVEIASAKNFPLTLAYAVTIHKAQGATLDKIKVSLKNLWEPGQAYVALSRVRSSEGLFVDEWTEQSIFADPVVTEFHRQLE